MEPLVSIITPIYNGEKYISTWAESLVLQTYKNLEINIINDGSTDNTHKTIKEIIPLLENEGYAVKYIKQKNCGAAAAVNNALKCVEGKYIMLFDVDDILMRDNIKAKVEFLIKHKDYGMVRNNGYYNKSSNLKLNAYLFVRKKKERKNEWIFEDILLGKTNNWPGTFMVDSEKLFEQLHGRNIYVSPYGQNMQLMLPIAYKYRSGFINRPLMRYIDYGQSHSRSKSIERQLELINGFEKNRIEIVNMLEIVDSEKKKYITQVNKFYMHIKLEFARKIGDKKSLEEQYKILQSKGWITKKDKIIYFLGKHKWMNVVYQSIIEYCGKARALYYHMEGIMRNDKIM